MLKLIDESVEYIKSKISSIPETVIVLGSGLGDFVQNIDNKIAIDYADIPNFPVSTVPGHAGKLVYGDICSKKILVMQGRFHYYEGYDFNTVSYPVKCFARLGIKNIILTCAVGAINKTFNVGDLVLIKDHIKFFIDNPLRGKNVEELSQRFFDMSDCYSKEYRKIAFDCAKKISLNLNEGVYAYMGGPNYETPAEINALRILGADVVGMSTVPEAITAVGCGLKVIGIACVSNMAAGVLDKSLNHEEVVEAGKKAAFKFEKIIKELIVNI